MKKMYKVVYNACYGGFGLSPEASKMLNRAKGYKKWSVEYIDPDYGSIDIDSDIPRHDPDLVRIVEKLGEDASAPMGELKIAEIDDPRYTIEEYDGYESVVTPSMIRWKVIDTPQSREEYPELFL